MASFTARDNFDSYSNGDLTGGSGGSGWATNWSGSIDYDIQGTTTFNGTTKAVTIIDTNTGNRSISRDLSAGIDGGDMFFTIQYTGSSDFFEIDINNTSDVNAAYINLVPGTTTINVGHSGGATALTSATSASTWYVINLSFLSATTFKARYKPAGGAYGSFTSTLTFSNSISSPARITLTQGNSGASNATFYFDELSFFDPESALRTFSVSDTVTGTDTITAQRGAVFSKSETITLTDTITMLKGKVFTLLETITTTDLFSLAYKWARQAKNSTSFSNVAKNTSAWTNASKDATTFTTQTKS